MKQSQQHCLLDKSTLCLSTEDIKVMKSAMALLKPFEAATREVSADEYPTVSKLIPLVRSLQQLTTGSSHVTKLGDQLCLQMRRRFLNMESNPLLAAATMLDPRMKKIAFADAGAAEQSVRRLTDEMAATGSADQDPESETSSTSATEESEGLWNSFDQQVADITSKRTSTTDAVVEMRQYMQRKNLGRKEDPLLWWEQNSEFFTKLQNLAMKYLCIPGTSVPSERLFSKVGELVSARRNRLKPKHVNMFLFLNKNI